MGKIADLIRNEEEMATREGLTLSNEHDLFGIRKVCHTKEGGEEWFMDYDSMKELEKNNEEGKGVSKGRLQNWGGEGLEYLKDRTWQITGGENKASRVEIWSPYHEDPRQRKVKSWLNVEITAYCRVEEKHNDIDYAWQLYARGGHHSEKRPCEGGALKARWYFEKDEDDFVNSVVKEVCHPFYSKNTAKKKNHHVEKGHGDGRWYGSKLLVYNIDEDGKTLTKMEVWTDAGDVKNEWKKITEHVDEGEWYVQKEKEINDEMVTFEEWCGDCNRARNEILKDPGGDKREEVDNKDNPNYNRNCVALRSDDETIQFKFLSCREIDPSKRIIE